VLSAYQFLIIGLMVGSFFAVLFVRALSEGFRLIEVRGAPASWLRTPR
jgi:uncharacterized membrane protein